MNYLAKNWTILRNASCLTSIGARKRPNSFFAPILRNQPTSPSAFADLCFRQFKTGTGVDALGNNTTGFDNTRNVSAQEQEEARI